MASVLDRFIPPDSVYSLVLLKGFKSISDYLLSLEAKGSLTIEELKDWTPIDSSGATLSFTSVTGSYLVLGGTIVAWGALTYPATADGSSVKIGGLPIKVRNTAASQGGGMISYTTESTAARVLPFANNTYVDIRNTSGTILTNATMSGDTIYFCVMYPY